MPDRLDELRRQRALAQEQVEWFDREITRELKATGGSPAIPAPTVTTRARAGAATTTTIDQEAEKIIERYRDPARPIQADVKRGCFVYLFAAFALVALGLVALYFFRHR